MKHEVRQKFSKFAILAPAAAFSATTIFGISSAQAEITNLPPVLDAQGQEVPGSIVSLERVTLGGIEQTILIRTQDSSLPVLLFLHGGPGGAIIPWVDFFHTPLLEENFTVVHWDQRGAGSSFSSDLTVEDLSPALLVADTLELTDLLRERFGQEQIFLAGQSWGSALGFMTIAEDSSPFLAFIAISERVAWNRSLTMGFDWVVEQAEKDGDAEILAQLHAIEPFDPLDEADLGVLGDATEFYRAGDYHTVGLWDTILSYTMSGESPYYTMDQINSYIPGLELSSAAIERGEFLGTYDLFTSFPESDIPVHFITGTEDHNTSGQLAFEYYETLEAPAKSFTWIDGAAHMVMMDQTDAWTEAMVNIKTETLGN
jgi:pimeloyl-ACP methyl ester carboxylesterase